MNSSDSYVLDKLHDLHEVIRIHRNLALMGEDPPEVVPSEIVPLVDYEVLARAWDMQDYRQVAILMTQAWMTIASEVEIPTMGVYQLIDESDIQS